MKDRLHQLTGRLAADLPSVNELRTTAAPTDAAAGSPYVCPGSPTPVSRAVHLARLHAAWAGCDQCLWRTDTEGLAERSSADTERIRVHRGDGIRRTEFGVRGPYVNRLDRHAAARLIRVFCDCLVRNSGNAAPLSAASDRRSAADGATGGDVAPQRWPLPGVIAGYDGRSSSPDIFVGVVSAVRELGLPVIDIGRCTAASLLEAVRSFGHVAGATIVTGAGAGPASTGFDVFDCHGECVPVVWKDHGIRLQPLAIDDPAHPADSLPPLLLTLPDDRQATGGSRRMSRSSGSHTIVDFEDRYRRWLLRWYPRPDHSRLVIRTDDSLVAERLRWLSEQLGLELLLRGTADPPVSWNPVWTLQIAEDDRQFQLWNAAGHRLTCSELAAFINRSARTQTSQITAHADDASHRFWITDTGRPTSGRAVEHIEDALAVLGLLLKLQPAA